MGGLPKKASQFKSLSASGDRHVLKVDGGGLLFDRLQPYSHKIEQAKIAAEGIVAAYNRIGYAAVGVGALDLAGGLGLLREMADRSEFSWLSANLVSAETGTNYFKPYISKQIGGLRIAILGMTSSRIEEEKLLDSAAAIRKWQEVLPSLLASIKGGHDLIIMLTDLDPGACSAIAMQHQEINLIIRAGGDIDNKQPRQLTSTTLLASTGKQGKYVGAMDISWSHPGNWSMDNELFLLLRKKQEGLARTIEKADALKNQPNMASMLGNLERKISMFQHEISELQQKIGTEPLSYFTNRFYAVETSIADDPEVLAIVNHTKERIGEVGRKKMAGKVGSRGTLIPEGYTGWKTCVKCHSEAAAKWRNTRHAGAFSTLVEKNQQFNFNCVPCHVTGIDFENVGKALSLSPVMQGVGCESCHGPGRGHAESVGEETLSAVSGKVCRGCHINEQDEDFDFFIDSRKIKCEI